MGGRLRPVHGSVRGRPKRMTPFVTNPAAVSQAADIASRGTDGQDGRSSRNRPEAKSASQVSHTQATAITARCSIPATEANAPVVL
jgi:hypothetical protein